LGPLRSPAVRLLAPAVVPTVACARLRVTVAATRAFGEKLLMQTPADS
jgi:hypothetical protein